MQGHWAVCLGTCASTEGQAEPACSKNPHMNSGPRLRMEARDGPVSQSARKVTKAPKTRLCRPFGHFPRQTSFQHVLDK